MWKITHIFDGEYGCEEVASDGSPKVSVTLENEMGQQKYVTVEDRWLVDNQLEEGSIWPEKTIWRDGIFGLVVGDALGVPVEFSNRSRRVEDPVTDMRAYGTHNQPAGTWSDDSSMVFATMASLIEKKTIDYEDIMKRFVSWWRQAEYTPFGEMFDIGTATVKALTRYLFKNVAPLEAGGTGERDNGNGSLMRIMPVCLYLYERQKQVCTSEDESIYIIHNVSALTHAHLRSQIACGMYYFLVKAIIEKEGSLQDRLQRGLDAAYRYYRRDMSNNKELAYYDRLMDLTAFGALPDNAIESSGYVVHTLEAAIWCLLNTNSYPEAVLKAVNLGDDTDTVGSVTGGLAGLYYGIEQIPSAWLEDIQRREWIEELVQEI